MTPPSLYKREPSVVGVVQCNLTAAVGPSVTDDESAGYSAGSMWIDVVGLAVYTCLDATAGAAQWTIPPALGVTPVANGGTGDTTLTNHGILIGAGTSQVNPTAAMTNGQLLVGQTGADPQPRTVSGDATVASSGALTVGNNKITQAKLTGTHTQHGVAVYGATDLAAVTPGGAGEVLTSDGTDWTSAPPAGGTPAYVIPLSPAAGVGPVAGHGAAPDTGTITAFAITVLAGSTGALTVKLQINGVDVTNSSTAIANTDAVGDVFVTPCTGANLVAAGDKLKAVITADASCILGVAAYVS